MAYGIGLTTAPWVRIGKAQSSVQRRLGAPGGLFSSMQWQWSGLNGDYRAKHLSRRWKLTIGWEHLSNTLRQATVS